MSLLATLETMLLDRLGPLGPLIAVGGLGFALVLVALPLLLRRPPDPLIKLRQEREARSQAEAAETGRPALRQAGSDKLDRFATFLEPQNADELSAARLKMLRAGYRDRNAVRLFHAAQFGLGLTALALGTLYALSKSGTGSVDSTQLVLYVLMPGAAGYYLPRYWIDSRIRARKTEIQNGFPDALDMLLVCVEAGQSLDQGIVRVAKELQPAYPALAEELDMVAHEVKAGKDRATVLRAFAERTDVLDVSSFVTVMIQSQSFGTSIAEALRIYAADMRDKRVMRAEEAANKLPVKMTLGTMMFTVPALLIILVGPSAYDIMELFNRTQK